MGGGGGFAEFDVEFKFAKIQNSHLWRGGGFAEFDAESKFAKNFLSFRAKMCLGMVFDFEYSGSRTTINLALLSNPRFLALNFQPANYTPTFIFTARLRSTMGGGGFILSTIWGGGGDILGL